MMQAEAVAKVIVDSNVAETVEPEAGEQKDNTKTNADNDHEPGSAVASPTSDTKTTISEIEVCGEGSEQQPPTRGFTTILDVPQLGSEQFYRMRKKRFKDQTAQEFFDGIKACLERGSGLDIYQVLAIRLATGNGIRKFGYICLPGYYSDIIKCLFVTLTQLCAFVVLLIDSLNNSDRENWCNTSFSDANYNDNNNSSYDGINFANFVGMKLMACLFTCTLYIMLFPQIQSVHTGIHQYVTSKESYAWIDSRVLEFGRRWNACILYMAMIESGLVIYFSDSALDIIKNALALLFIPTLDNMAVDAVDYGKLRCWFEKMEDNGLVEKLFECEEINFDKKFPCMTRMLRIIAYPLLFVTVVGIPFFAVWIGICY